MTFIPTQETAIKALKSFIPSTSGEVISLEEIFTAANRNLEEKKGNKKWLGVKLAYIKPYNFVTTKLGIENGKNVITHLALTDQGKIALGRMEGKLNEVSRSITSQNEVLISATPQTTYIATIMTQLSNANPDKEIVFDSMDGTVSIKSKE